jgi:hypothetical protein
MQVIANTTTLVTDGIISADQAKHIETRARDVMIQLAINIILCGGILAATTGFIFWLADATAVAALGAGMLLLGYSILRRDSLLLAMFGQAATLIGAGLLIGGFAVEMFKNQPSIATIATLSVGALVVAIAALTFHKQTKHHFITGAILVMGAALHLSGAIHLVKEINLSGWFLTLAYLYGTVLIAGVGTYVNVRFITALAIIPFAQMLSTSSNYNHAVYAFYSEESTLSIVQMLALIGLLLWLGSRWDERLRRHSAILAVMAFIIANMCALVGSLWGDIIGEHIWGPQRPSYIDHAPHDTLLEARRHFQDLHQSFIASSITISEHVYSIVWAIALALTAGFAAHKSLRGLFNTAITFGVIHAYTQAFESFVEEPLAYAIGGLIAIPIAWGIWRLNVWLTLRAQTVSTI